VGHPTLLRPRRHRLRRLATKTALPPRAQNTPKTSSARARPAAKITGRAIQVTRRTRRLSGRKWRAETSYAITSLPPAQASPAQLAEWIRGHWKIENQLHWVRDVTFGEDLSTARTGTGPHVMAAIRNLVISILRLAGHASIARALRHTGRDPARAFRLLTGRRVALAAITFDAAVSGRSGSEALMAGMVPTTVRMASH
jgi:predicted transposase YbfD/YdcC